MTIKAAGKEQQVTETTALTVADALAAAKITVDGNDKLSAAPTAQLKDGATLRYTRVDVKTKTKKKVGGVQDRAQGDRRPSTRARPRSTPRA